jgi:RNA polymerase sigma-70 factor (ECF subfamily)
MSIEPSDEQLLASGVAEDFGALYERTYPLVRAYLRRRAGARPDLVLDLLAETYARALERREQFDPERGQAVVWLLGIATHLCLDATRRGRVADQARRRLGMERIYVEDDQLELVERQTISDMQIALNKLPEEQREAVERRVLQEDAYAAIAEQVGCSEQVVRKRVSRGLSALRRTSKETV